MKKTYIFNYKFNSVFLKTFIILILASIIPVLVANTIIHRQSTKIIHEQTGKANINRLDKTSQTIDLVFSQMNQIMPQLGRDPNIVNAVINPDYNFISRNSEIISNIRNVASSTNYILSIYIYLAHDNTVLSSSGGIYKFDEFYDKDWLQSYNSFVLGTHQLDTRKISDALGNKFNCITLIRNLPYSSWSKLGAIVININEDKLYETIEGLENNNKEEIYIIDEEGNILSHKDKSKLYTNINQLPYIKKILNNNNGFFIEEVNNKKMHFTYVTSYYNRWKYIYAIPLETLQNNSTVVSRIIIMITLIYIVLALILSFLISKGIYHPIEELMNIVVKSSKLTLNGQNHYIKNEYDFLGQAYNDVIDKNKNMEVIINNAKPTIKEKLFTNLIMGKNNNVQEITEKLEFLNICFNMNNFIVIGMQIDSYNEFRNKYDERDRNLYKIELGNLIEKIISKEHKGVCVEVESDQLAAVINFPDNTSQMNAKEQTIVIARNIQMEVKKYLPFTITLGIGRMYKDITNVKLSYNEAINALKYKLYQGKNEIINIDEVEIQSEELYYYDSEKEKMLINNLKVGQQKEVDIVIDELFQEIIEHKSYSYTYVQQVFIRIISLIIELIINMGLDVEEVFGDKYNLYEEFSDKETIQDMKVWLTKICHICVYEIDKINHSKSHKHIEKILEFIDMNLSHNISLNDIADFIGLNPSYVSKIFKDHIGKNYVDYLNRSRIEKAKQLLINTKLAVKEVGFRVGFNSVQTFTRTFKKYEKITPGKFRENA